MRKIQIAAAIVLVACLNSQVFASGWSVSKYVSPIDDSDVLQISTNAIGSYSDKSGRSGRASIIIQCERNTTLFVLMLPELYVSDHGEWGDVTFRIDSKKATTLGMLAANDHGSLALRGGAAISLIKQMLDSEKTFVRVLPVNENSIDMRFNVDGLADSVLPVRHACEW